MNIEYQKKNDVGILVINGRLDAYSAPNLKTQFQEYSRDTANFVLDLHNLDFLDSTGLGSIVACLKAASEAGGDIRIANMSEKPRLVFQITRAYKIFEIYDDLETAVASFSS